MNTKEETTISKYAESDKDELLLLSGEERLSYFSEKPDLKPKSFKERCQSFFRSISL